MGEVDIYKVLELVFPLLAVIFGGYFASAKSKLGSVTTLMEDVNKALADGVLSQDEMKIIVADVMKLLGKGEAVTK